MVEADYKKLEEAAQRIGVSADQKIVQLITRSYLIDGTKGIQNPLGMIASKLGMEATLITSPANSLENFKLALEKAALEVESSTFVSQVLALGEMLLSEKEKNEGALLLDLGGEISQLAIFQEGRFHNLRALELGGNTLTRMLSRRFDLSLPQAEEIKKQYLYAEVPADKADLEIELANSKTTVRELSETVSRALSALVEWIKAELGGWQKIDLYPRYIILTGGGSLLKGLNEFLSRELNLSLRPGKINGLKQPAEWEESPRFHCALAVLLYGIRLRMEQELAKASTPSKALFQHFKKWLEEAFL